MSAKKINAGPINTHCWISPANPLLFSWEFPPYDFVTISYSINPFVFVKHRLS